MGGSGGGGVGGAGSGLQVVDALWGRRFGEFDDQEAFALTVDINGNAIAAGYFSGTIDFGSNIFMSAGAKDIFIVKLDPAGNLIWHKQFGGAGLDIPIAVTTDNAGSVLVAGLTSGILDFGGGPLLGDGTMDGFAVKLSPAGDHIWSKRFGGPGTQEALGISADGAGNVLVSGDFEGAVNFGGGALTSQGDADVFVVKFGPNGVHKWSKRFGNALTQISRAVASDAAGNVFITGDFGGTIDFGGGLLASNNASTVFVAKFDAAGTHAWSKAFVATKGGTGLGLTVDQGGNALLGGDAFGTINFGGGALTSAGDCDIYVAKLDGAGNHLWSKLFGGANCDRGRRVAVDGAGNVFVTGDFAGAVDFGGVPLMSNGGSSDIYVLKLDAGGVHVWSRRYGGPAGDRAIGIGADAAGNVLLAGGFSTALDLGVDVLVSADAADVFVAKLPP